MTRTSGLHCWISFYESFIPIKLTHEFLMENPEPFGCGYSIIIDECHGGIIICDATTNLDCLLNEQHSNEDSEKLPRHPRESFDQRTSAKSSENEEQCRCPHAHPATIHGQESNRWSSKSGPISLQEHRKMLKQHEGRIRHKLKLCLLKKCQTSTCDWLRLLKIWSGNSARPCWFSNAWDLRVSKSTNKTFFLVFFV